MKFKKWMCTLAAVAFSTMAFAGNTSDLKVLIDQFFTPMEQVEQAGQNLSAEEQEILKTMKALKSGLLTYEEHLTANQLTETDKAIHVSLNTTIPAIFNKIQESSDEVADEMEPVLKKLTEDILNNQNQFKKEEINAEAGQGVILIFSYTKAEVDGVLLGRASRVMQQELIQMMQDLFGSAAE